MADDASWRDLPNKGMTMLPALVLALQTADTVRVTERLCADCEIRIDSVAVIGTADGAGALNGRQIVVARDRQGRYLVAGAASPSQVSVFDSHGAFLRRVGRSGGGPGEYRRIWRVYPYEGGVIITDDIAKRHTVLNANFEYVSSTPVIGTPEGMLVGPGGTRVEATIIRSGQDAGFSVFVKSAAGQVRHRLAPTPVPYRERMRDAYRRILTPGLTPADFWMTSRHEYAFARCWFVSGACTRFERPASWFPSRSPTESRTDESMEHIPPTPQLLGVSLDGPRFAWTISLVADARWREGLSKQTRPHVSIENADRYWDSVIERINVETGTVVASVRIDQALTLGPLTGGYSAFYTEQPDGVPRVVIVQLRVGGSR